MKWVKDNTRRFSDRPFYEDEELDSLCETQVSSFLRAKYGRVVFPISTEDLTVLIEQVTLDLDLYADLTAEGENVDGMTDFLPGSKPRVRISEHLSTNPAYHNRLRTTLTHELGHVKLQAFLFPFDQPQLFESSRDNRSPRCKRETILYAGQVDWMEWQAGYASGAYLMPKTHVREIVAKVPVAGTISASSTVGGKLVAEIQSQFQVSEEAARVRLLKLGYLSDMSPNSKTLF